ncbi:MAG: L-serine ammonia-lyase, iron-sulfur-dependent, subunit alpha [Patescibacteria group bacterium]
MNILKEVLRNEVRPALGCTEPIAVAYACSLAMAAIKNKHPQDSHEILEITVIVDPGVLKNGLGVCIPNTNGQKGNCIAAALGAICGDSALQLRVLEKVAPDDLVKAEKMVREGKAHVLCEAHDSLYIKATVKTSTGNASAIIRDSHTNVVAILVDGVVIDGSVEEDCATVVNKVAPYRQNMSTMRIADLIDCAQGLDEDDYQYLLRGVEMNLVLSRAGLQLGKFGSQLAAMAAQANLENELFKSTQILVSCATDARMAGVNLPAMSSGGSGNQGIVAILVPYNVGTKEGIPERRIVESIALSHLLNSYVKQYTGEIAPICGCAIAAGLGAAGAIAYQLSPRAETVGLAINNVVGDITGMLCDGAKGGCTLKVLSSTDSAIRAAYFAINGFFISSSDGIISEAPEETIRNLGRLCALGLDHLNGTVLDIMINKKS